MDNNNNNQIENENENENEMKNLEKKDSISKQDFDKLKQFDFFPKSILIDIQNKVIQDNQKEIENKEKEIEEKWKKEVEDKNREIEEKWKKEVEDKNKEIEKNQKENQQMKIEIEEKWKKEVEKMKPTFDKYGDQYQKDLEYEKKLEEIRKNFPQFSDSEIIQDIEYVKKLQEWINDNDFFSKMKKDFQQKRDGFNSQIWHKTVDGKGKTLVIIKTKDNFIFGGFTKVGFNGNSGCINDSNAFIFSLRNDKGDRIPAKFTYKQGYAIYSDLSCGPLFGNGGYDFYLNSNLQPGYSNFGYNYNPPNGITYNTDSGKSYLAGSYNKWVVDEVESYFI